MNDEKAEKLIEQSFKDENVAFFYRHYKEYGHCEEAMLNAIHRVTEIPKYQIVTYLNKKGFSYATDKKGSSS
jgi:hypothetical protein